MSDNTSYSDEPKFRNLYVLFYRELILTAINSFLKLKKEDTGLDWEVRTAEQVIHSATGPNIIDLFIWIGKSESFAEESNDKDSIVFIRSCSHASSNIDIPKGLQKCWKQMTDYLIDEGLSSIMEIKKHTIY